MKQDDSDIFAIDDDAFLNGGEDFASEPAAAPAASPSAPAPVAAPAPAPVAPTPTPTPAAPAPVAAPAPQATPTIGRFSKNFASSSSLIGVPYEPEKTEEPKQPQQEQNTQLSQPQASATAAQAAEAPAQTIEETPKVDELETEATEPKSETPSIEEPKVDTTAPVAAEPETKAEAPVAAEPKVETATTPAEEPKTETKPEDNTTTTEEPKTETTTPTIEEPKVETATTPAEELKTEAEASTTEEPKVEVTEEKKDISPTTEVSMMDVRPHDKSENPFLKDGSFHKLDDSAPVETPKISSFEPTGGSFVETQVEPMVPEKVRPYPGIPSHDDDDAPAVSYAMTPSQTMAEEYETKTLNEKAKHKTEEQTIQMPSQEMADSFVATPIDVPALAKAMHHEEADLEKKRQEEAASEEPVVAGPVISSAGIASLTDKGAPVTTPKTPANTPAAPEKEEKPAEPEQPVVTGTPILSDSNETRVDEPKATEAPAANPETEEKAAPKEATEEKAAEEKPEEKPAEEPTETPAAPAATEAPAPAPEAQPGNQSKPPKAKNTHALLFVIVGCVALALIVGLVFLIIALFNKPVEEEKPKEEPVSELEVFLLPNDSKEYALFDETGKRLTDFKYGQDSRGVKNGRLVVTDAKSGDYGVIDKDGKTLIEFGKYAEITEAGALYAVMDESKNRFLIDVDGSEILAFEKDTKVLANCDNIAIIAHGSKVMFYGTSKEAVLTVDRPKDKSGNYRDVEDGSNRTDDYLVAFFNGTNYVFNIKTAKYLSGFKSKSPFSIVGTGSIAGEIVVLAPSSEDHGKNAQLVTNDKVIEVHDGCDDVYSSAYYPTCSIGEKQYWVNENDGSIGMRTDDKYLTSKTTYVMTNVKDELEFYYDGELVKTLEKCHEIFYPRSKGLSLYTGEISHYVLLNNCGKDGKAPFFEYYTLNGEKAFDGEYSSASEFDKNGEAVVAADGKVFMIDMKGKKVSNNYTSIIKYVPGLYKAKSLDLSRNYIINSKTNAIMAYKESDYISNVSYVTLDSGETIVGIKEGGILTVYDEDGKEKFRIEGEESDYYHFSEYAIVSASEDLSNCKIYTLDGKKFHEYTIDTSELFND